MVILPLICRDLPLTGSQTWDYFPYDLLVYNCRLENKWSPWTRRLKCSSWTFGKRFGNFRYVRNNPMDTLILHCSSCNICSHLLNDYSDFKIGIYKRKQVNIKMYCFQKSHCLANGDTSIYCLYNNNIYMYVW